MTDTVTYERRDAVAILTLNRPPVNAIDGSIRAGLMAGVAQANADDAVKAILIVGAGKSFSAGADLRELSGEAEAPSYADAYGAVETSAKPVIAALSGASFGGGVELALACHYRVATPETKLTLPEITLGIVPGAGATQRLPRLVGAMQALQIMVDGAPVPAAKAKDIGMIDAIVEGSALDGGLAYANTLIADGAAARPTRDKAVDATGFDKDAIDAYLKTKAKALKGRTTQNAILQAVQAAADLPFDQGLTIEKTVSDASLKSVEGKGLIHAFFADGAVGRIPGLDLNVKPAPINKAAVVGAGTMGGGIAMALADAGVPVALIEAEQANLDRGLATIRKNYEVQVTRGRITAEQLEQRMALIAPSLDYAAASDVDVVIEAVFENMEVKKAVMKKLDAVLPPHAILASNTSSLSMTELAAATSRPQNVIGLHFFVPANVMRLLEIVRGKQTSDQTIVTGLAVAKLLRKIGVVVGDDFGFVGNRMMMDGFWREADLMMVEGVSPQRVDKGVEAFGFAMGPAAVNDMAGIDVGTKMRAAGKLVRAQPSTYHVLGDALTEAGRIGSKSGAGFFRYEPGDRTGHEDPKVAQIAADLAKAHNIEQREISDEEIGERSALSLINVGAQILDDGVASRASDIDVIWNNGYGYPRWRGGPMQHADQLGLPKVLDRIRFYEARYGDAWKPSPLLVKLAEEGKSFADYDAAK